MKEQRIDGQVFESGGVYYIMIEGCAMPIDSLQDHCRKHPDVAPCPDEYLKQASQVVLKGKDAGGGLFKKGNLTARAEFSEELTRAAQQAGIATQDQAVKQVFTVFSRRKGK